MKTVTIAAVVILQACAKPSGAPATSSPQPEQTQVLDVPKDDPEPQPGSRSVSVRILLRNFELPPCTPGHEGETYFIDSESLFKYCDGTAWKVLDLHGPKGDPGSPGISTLVLTVAEPPGGNCSAGGTKLTAGSDGNSDGAFATDETVATSYVCNAASGLSMESSLLRTGVESAGAMCATGGVRVESGIDDGSGGGTQGNGVLDVGEVDETQYVCNGSGGIAGASGTPGTAGELGFNALVKITSESAGANCVHAGKRIEAGQDNGDGGGNPRNGILEAGEVDSATYVCNGAPGAVGSSGTSGFNSLIKITAEAAGINCLTGGKKIQSGLDNGDSGGTPSNGMLEIGEIDAAEYVCNGEATALKLYKADNTAIAYFVSSVLNETAVMVRDLSLNKKTVYSVASTTTVIPAKQLDVGLDSIMFMSSDCTGQAYSRIHAENQLAAFSNLYLAFATGWLPDHEYTITSGVSQSLTSNSHLGCTVTPCNTLGALSCNTSAHPMTENYVPITIVTRYFSKDVGSGWYIAP